MNDLKKEAYGPHGDPSRHRAIQDLRDGLRSVAPCEGRVALIVRRLADGTRETPERAMLTIEDGLEGDGWSRRPPRNPEAQLAVMRREVAELIANGQALATFGDNLFVDFDLGASALPFHTRLRVGDAIVEMTEKPHNGCSKFKERFGKDALDFVQAPETRHFNLRGVYWKVVQSGAILVGAPIRTIE